MDEKGTLIGYITREYILVPKEEKKAFIRQDGKREWVSSLYCVSAAGNSIKTFLIIKATYLKEDYFNCASDITIYMSLKGWISTEAALI